MAFLSPFCTLDFKTNLSLEHFVAVVHRSQVTKISVCVAWPFDFTLTFVPT